MTDTPIPCCDRNILQLNIHIIFSYIPLQISIRVCISGVRREKQSNCAVEGKIGKGQTFKELSAVDLTGGDFESNDMALSNFTKGQQAIF